ncbi:hypothetical protein ACTMQP_12510 [Pseudomonas aeruginosa]|uniref:hypothetical protein n=1 Tax=Pseudomonas aeruginosa TaxID=287 RepID=UPI002FE50862
MLPLPAAGAGATGDTTMSSTQHQLIEQCATRLRGIVEALDNIHDNTPHRWSTDLDDVHSSAESLLALIKDQAPTQAAQGLAGAALARVAELEMLLRKPSTNGLMQFSTVDEEMAVQAALGGAPVSQAQQLHDLDKQCRDDVARALGLRPSQERGFAWSYLLTSIKSCVKASEDSAQAQHSVPDGAADLCRFLAKLYCELDGLRYSTAKLPAEQIADALIFKWPVLQGARNQLNIKRISEQPYDESKLHSAIAAMLAAAPGKEVPQAWLDVQAERRRQIEAEGWTPEHDDEHADGQMAQAAGCYALHAGGIGTDWPDGRQNGAALFWPWDRDSWKPTTPRRDLVKACALALAEIERLDRAGISQSPQPGATTASS